jgi:hypothetical protein
MATQQQRTPAERGLKPRGRLDIEATKRVTYRDGDFLLFLAPPEPAAAGATAATFSSAFLPSGARGFGPKDSGAFFRRRFGSVTSVAESEFLLPDTSSRSVGSELSLFRLFRPLHGHEDLCGGEELRVVLAMTSAVHANSIQERYRRRTKPFAGRVFRDTRPPQCGRPQVIVGPGSQPQPYCTSFVGVAWLCRAPLRYRVCRVALLGRCGLPKSPTSIRRVKKAAFEARANSTASGRLCSSLASTRLGQVPGSSVTTQGQEGDAGGRYLLGLHAQVRVGSQWRPRRWAC